METVIHSWRYQTTQTKCHFSGFRVQVNKCHVLKRVSGLEFKVADEVKDQGWWNKKGHQLHRSTDDLILTDDEKLAIWTSNSANRTSKNQQLCIIGHLSDRFLIHPFVLIISTTRSSQHFCLHIAGFVFWEAWIEVNPKTTNQTGLLIVHPTTHSLISYESSIVVVKSSLYIMTVSPFQLEAELVHLVGHSDSAIDS